jgi:hypothetical protein
MVAFDPAKLDRTAETIAQLLEAAPEAMVLMSADGRIVRVNARLKSCSGTPRRSWSGKT